MVPHLRIEEAIGLDSACVVIGVPDAQRGERLAVLYTNSDAEPATLVERLKYRGAAITLDSETRELLSRGEHSHVRYWQD